MVEEKTVEKTVWPNFEILKFLYISTRKDKTLREMSKRVNTVSVKKPFEITGRKAMKRKISIR